MNAPAESNDQNWEQLKRLLGANSPYLPLQPLVDCGKSSSEIRVTSLELSLLLPVVLRFPTAEHESATEPHHKLEAALAFMQKNSSWREVTTAMPPEFPNRPLELDGQLNDEAWRAMQDYSEMLYFHPFVRNFLYPTRDDVRFAQDHKQPVVNRNLRTLERIDLESVEVAWTSDKQQHIRKLDCTRCRFFVFDVGVAVLEVSLKLSPEVPTTLHQTLCMLDYMRRIYAPYFMDGEKGLGAGRSLDELKLKFRPRGESKCGFGSAKRDSEGGLDADGLKEVALQVNKLAKDREPPMATPWADLLSPLQSKGICAHHDVRVASPGNEIDCPIEFQLVLDERMQLMNFMQVDDIDGITPGDWIRIANADDAGDSGCYPYSPAFVEAGNFADMQYGRYWDQRSIPEVAQWLCRTRWLCSGYHLAVVGSQGNWFFNETRASLRTQFSRHYFKLYLIAQMQLATLLNLKQRISNALDDLRSGHQRHKDQVTSDGREKFAAQMLAIESEFIYFRNTYWVPEVSNQIQAQELFDLITRHLGTKKWFESLRDEIKDASNYIQTRDMVGSVRAMHHMQTNVEWVELFIIGVYAIELPYAFSHIWHIKPANHFFKIAVSLMVLITIGRVAWLTKPWQVSHGHVHEKQSPNYRRNILLGLAIAWFFVLVFSVFVDFFLAEPPSDNH